MTYILKNKNLELHIDDPNENYNFSRFDWSGKITQLKYKGIPFSVNERTDNHIENDFGKGFYNEFGMDTALGFEEAEIGGWFHKIGIGYLKKDSDSYDFTKKYKILPADFTIESNDNYIKITCTTKEINGYSYVLIKSFSLIEAGFQIDYSLENTGEKDIINEEYTHNFLAINNDIMSENYELNFPFNLDSSTFYSLVNPEQKVEIFSDKFAFNGTPNDQFFFSNLVDNKQIANQWKLIHKQLKLGIQESTSFTTDKVNLWGWQHVISPELFCKIFVKSRETYQWKRVYKVFEI